MTEHRIAQVEALAKLREKAQLMPDVPEAALALGEALYQAGHMPAAIAEAQRALRLDPNLPRARYLLGCCWLEAGEAEKALEAFAKVLPGVGPQLAQKIAEAHAIQDAPRAAPGYVRHLFDQFSADYDRRMLNELSYRAPTILRELWDLVGGARKELNILDLGCGTGLSGAAFKTIARRLDGVDLSPQMIAKARESGIYNSLAVADLEAALADNGATYDLILAADTLVYLGDLAPTFLGAAARLKPDGFFLFTVERSEGEGFELGPKRRWRHSESYLRKQAAAVHLDVAGLMTCTPRNEAKAPVQGFAVALHRA